MSQSLMQYWERKHNESWIARWHRLTDNSPKDSLEATKHLNCGAIGMGRMIGSDACTKSSQEFKNNEQG